MICPHEIYRFVNPVVRHQTEFAAIHRQPTVFPEPERAPVTKPPICRVHRQPTVFHGGSRHQTAHSSSSNGVSWRWPSPNGTFTVIQRCFTEAAVTKRHFPSPSSNGGSRHQTALQNKGACCPAWRTPSQNGKETVESPPSNGNSSSLAFLSTMEETNANRLVRKDPPNG